VEIVLEASGDARWSSARRLIIRVRPGPSPQALARIPVFGASAVVSRSGPRRRIDGRRGGSDSPGRARRGRPVLSRIEDELASRTANLAACRQRLRHSQRPLTPRTDVPVGAHGLSRVLGCVAESLATIVAPFFGRDMFF